MQAQAPTGGTPRHAGQQFTEADVGARQAGQPQPVFVGLPRLCDARPQPVQRGHAADQRQQVQQLRRPAADALQPGQRFTVSRLQRRVELQPGRPDDEEQQARADDRTPQRTAPPRTAGAEDAGTGVEHQRGQRRQPAPCRHADRTQAARPQRFHHRARRAGEQPCIDRRERCRQPAVAVVAVTGDRTRTDDRVAGAAQRRRGRPHQQPHGHQPQESRQADLVGGGRLLRHLRRGTEA